MTAIDQIIANLRLEEQEKIAQASAKSYRLPYAKLSGYPITPEVLELIDPKTAAILQAVAFAKSANELKVAIAIPETDAHKKYFGELAQKLSQTIKVAYCSQMSLAYAMSLYTKFSQEKKEKAQVESTKRGDEFVAAIKSIKDVGDQIKKVTTTQLIDLLFAGAVLTEASDIHIEPNEASARVRYRIDGVLQDVGALSIEQFRSAAARIKNLCKLKLDVTGAPQDGRFEMRAANHLIDVRTSVLPATYGEDIVMRILLQEGQFLTLEELNISPIAMELIDQAIHQPHGMILNTGPTGSGKTTTLYAILSELNSSEKKIITIEDPVEYRLSGINQVQVNKEAKLTFASILRSVMRQDPDIIMVGEIRDGETAQIALQAALTGHLVLSTLHTNSAAAAIPRLLNMGIEPYLLAGSINLIIAQRLVRRICPTCKGKNKSCPDCGGTFYKGRLPIIEALKPSEKFNELIARKASIAEFEKRAVELGMQDMLEDGLSKVEAGLTTNEEVERVSRDID